jgi:signal transduction histidine kinase
VRFLLDPVLQRHSLAIDIQSSGDLTIHAFPGETRQVLLNLVRNACEASSRPGSHVTIKLTGRASDVEVVVADQGSGIDPSLMQTLFAFGRSTKGEQGNGMGLWTVKHILERHGGDIECSSTPGVGTAFTLHWPRKLESAAPQVAALTVA